MILPTGAETFSEAIKVRLRSTRAPLHADASLHAYALSAAISTLSNYDNMST